MEQKVTKCRLLCTQYGFLILLICNQQSCKTNEYVFYSVSLTCVVDISSNMQEILTGKLFQKVAKDSVHQQNEI